MPSNVSASELIQPTGRDIALPADVRRPPAIVIDGVVLALAMASDIVAGPLTASPRMHWAWFLFYALSLLTLLAARGAYRARLKPEPLDELWLLVSSTLIATMATISVAVLAEGRGELATAMAWLCLFSTLWLATGRSALIARRAGARRRGDGRLPTLIVGAGKVAHLAAKRLREQPELGLEPVGFLDEQPRDGSSDLPVVGASCDLARVLEERRIRHVVIAFSTAESEVPLEMVEQCLARGVGVAVVPRLFEHIPHPTDVCYLGGLPLVSIQPSKPDDWRLKIKYALDHLLALLALVLLSPLLAVIAVGVRLSTGGPVLFRQVRVGCRQQSFEMLKFRSMRGDEPPEQDELPEDVAPGGIESPERATWFGNLIRKWSLDELPQLVNVVRGEMSLIGPRPERPKFVELFSSRVHRYDERHRVRSGITGWAQVHGLRGPTSLSDRIEWDNWYIENWSLWLDLKIALMTLGVFRR
jgi:exopolysaccharide biosynthesis polyprenyl glycosylphosphotransferase